VFADEINRNYLITSEENKQVNKLPFAIKKLITDRANHALYTSTQKNIVKRRDGN